MRRSLTFRAEAWALARPFRISRGVKTRAIVVVAEARDGPYCGVGEGVPYARYGESAESVCAQIASIAAVFAAGLDRAQLQHALPPGAARNAVDCALWDLEAKQTGAPVAQRLGVAPPSSLTSAVTISIDTPERMGEAAAAIAGAPLIKAKVDANDPLAAVRAVRAAAPRARLIVDPNEGWSFALLTQLLPDLAALDVALIEQPIPACEDAALEGLKSPAPICADEAAHTTADLERAARRYQAVNVKLDKTGGLTEALAMIARAKQLQLTPMVGCMVCTSLSIAPALLIAGEAAFVDLDGPWWLARDRADAMRYEDGKLIPPKTGWGV